MKVVTFGSFADFVMCYGTGLMLKYMILNSFFLYLSSPNAKMGCQGSEVQILSHRPTIFLISLGSTP